MRRDIEFDAEGVTLRGWLYLPDGAAGAAPVVVMAHGFSAVKEMYLDSFAEAFAAGGLAALVFDNRNFGASDGEPRQEIDPWAQVRDYRHAISWAQTLPDIDAERVGYLGMSHGGEMALKIASEYHGFRAMVASEPASHEFLRLRPDETAQVDPATGLLDVDRMLMREPEKVRARITEDVAGERVSTIETPIFVQGRNSDELQGVFRVSYDLLHEAGKPAEWETYEHDLHGFVYPIRKDDGTYDPDPVQRKAVADVLDFFGRYM
jgi:dienelactone hydrolase